MENLLSIDREMEGLEDIVRIPSRTKKRVIKFLEKGAF